MAGIILWILCGSRVNDSDRMSKWRKEGTLYTDVKGEGRPESRNVVNWKREKGTQEEAWAERVLKNYRRAFPIEPYFAYFCKRIEERGEFAGNVPNTYIKKRTEAHSSACT